MAGDAKLEIGYGLGKGDDSFATGVETARQALASIREYAPSLVTVFASVRYDLEELLRGVHAVVGDVPVVGATTAGEICNGSHHESAVVTILASPYLEVSVGVGENVSQGWRQAVTQAIGSPGMAPFFSPDDNTVWSELTLQGKSTFALLFTPGQSPHSVPLSFEILEELKHLSQGRLPFIGGCAADDWRLKTYYVFCGRRAYPDSMVVAVCQTRLRFGIALAHGFHPTGQRALVTRAISHEVLELDGQNAAAVYCRMQGMTRQALEGQHLTLTTGRPLGTLDPYGQYSLNVAGFFTPGEGIQVAQPVAEGTILEILEATPESMVDAGREALKKALLRGSITQPAAILTFSCALRARFLGDRLAEEIKGMQEILPEVQITGFYSFGEQGLADDGVNRNNNEVIAVLVLSRELSFAAQVALERERLRSEVEQAEAVKTAYEALKKEVAERQKAEQALRDSERFLANIFDSIQDGLSILDADFNIRRVNTTIERWYAHSLPLIGKKCFQSYHLLDKPCAVCPVSQTLTTGKPAFETVAKTGPKGEIIGWLDLYSFPLLNQADGKVEGAIEYIRDITEHKLAEEALHRSEEQLRQSQKMEAIGRLAGGVAHDFNNILTGISGYSEMLLLNLPNEDLLRQDVLQIQQATERAATLTRQLLAFSRKQVIQPQRLNLNEVMANMDKMLRRILSEDIDLQTFLGPDLGRVNADPGQMEQVILNLVINARDAMPQGGKVTLETANVELDEDYVRKHAQAKPGIYVLLAVSDTGVGLTPETQEHLFEPFFTTKEQGKGTGLGLSMVYGIVEHAGGFIGVYSEPDHGTTLKIYLPRLDKATEAAQSTRPSTSAEPGWETILLVEDEDLVRKVLSRMLALNGYTVLEAAIGPEALRINQEHQAPIQLLLTDVVMPGMSGPKLAEALVPLRPGMKVLYMSGHTENAIVHHGVLEPGIAFIQKPFRHSALLQKVREVLSSTNVRNYPDVN